MKKYLLLLFSLLMLPLLGFSQNKTSSTIEGVVKDAQGNPLPGANVVAIHKPTGSRYGTSTRTNGHFTLSNVQAGGPYVVQVSFVGYNPKKKQIANIRLSQTVTINFSLEEGQLSLEQISVTARVNPVFDSDHTGAQTNISREDIDRTPQLSRSLSSYTSLTPHSTGGNTFGGANNNYNNILVDGATLNDIFGLAGSGIPGGQAGVQSPISIDAIKEFNVDVAPFGVTNNNFNGAQVNAITKSGTNEYHGSAYFQLRNERLEGRYELNQGNDRKSSKAGDFNQKFYGLSIGGPIIKDKLFFFVNGELKREDTPVGGGYQGTNLDNIFPRPKSYFTNLSNILMNPQQYFGSDYSYDPGSINPISQETNNNKVLAKLNWNINDQEKLTLRYNHVDAQEGEGISRNQHTFTFGNQQYIFHDKQNSFVAELNSNFGSKASNTFRGVYTRIRDRRAPVAKPYPGLDFYTTTIDGNYGPYNVYAGTEPYSGKNSLDQDLFELTDNFIYNIGNNKLTFGTSNQFYHFNNLFVRNTYGYYDYDSVDQLTSDDPGDKPYEYSYSYLLPGGKPRAKFKAFQLGFYGQDQWSPTENFTLTAGLRIDIPFLPDQPSYNENAEDAFGYDTRNVASGNILWSPRLGFNWQAVQGEYTTQIRGGVGLFSGPPPFVWLSNQYSNTGNDYGRIDVTGNQVPDGFKFHPDPNNQPTPENSNLENPTTEVDLIDKDFKYPQSLKFDLAVDQELPGGITATLEGIYTDGINNILYKNINLVQTGTTPYGRPLYGQTSFDSNGAERDALNSPLVDKQNFTDAILLTNTNKGHRYSLTAELNKRFDTGLRFDLSYTYNRAKDVSIGTSSQAVSNWTYNEAKDVNNPRLGTAPFERRHRILAKASYKAVYGRGFSTTVSLIYDGHSGSPYSWVYDGNANGDRAAGSQENDLVYVPNDLTDAQAIGNDQREVVVASKNRAALNAFINDHPSLDNYRGEIVPRNTAREPWTNFLDLRVNQHIGTVNGQSLEFTASIFNVLNLINYRWGKQQYISYDAAPWTITEYVTQEYIDNNYDSIDNLTESDIGKPVIEFDPQSNYRSNLYQTDNIGSRWRLQVGVKYNF